MISAETARHNVNQYEIEIYQQTETKVLELIDTMSKSIEYHSRNGFDCLNFAPYEKTRFTSDHVMNIAHEIFRKIFEANGYKIICNDVAKNILKVQW